jgi:hypothetical protein
MKTLKTLVLVTLMLVAVSGWAVTIPMPLGTSATVNSGTITVQYGDEWMQRPVKSTTLKSNIISNASGAASITFKEIYGYVTRIVWIPGSSGLQPSVDYDCTVTDVDGWGIDQTNGTNLNNAAVECFNLTVPVHVHGDLTVSATNMGAANGLTVRIYIQR